jgi:putative FmdB family regulatory protein
MTELKPRKRSSMPVYRFKCAECSTEIEQTWPIKEIPDFIRCPNCGKFAQRVPSKFSFVMKI